jgi:hypothetical protein
VVDEINVTPVPLVPSCHMGLIYYRGDLFDVIHMGILLGQMEAKLDENSHVVLLKWSSKKLALVPDHIVGLIWVEDSKGGQTVYAHYPPRLGEIDLPAIARHEPTGAGQQGAYTVRLISPDYIWKKVSEPSYGPNKV